MVGTALKKSRDVVELRKFRGAIRGQITSVLNKLEALFAQKVEDDFDHGRILITEVNRLEARLKDKLDLFQNSTIDAASSGMKEQTLIKRLS